MATNTCDECSIVFEGHGNKKWCPSCVDAKNTKQDMFCEKCGIEIYGKISKRFCDICKIERAQELSAILNKTSRAQERRKESNDRHGQRIRSYVELLKDNPCSDCGIVFAPEAMDFDHRPGETKIMSVSDLVRGRYSEATILEEIAKCDLVCSNCHRVRSRLRANERIDDLPPFIPFPKIPRYRRNIIVSEKLDGTNAKIIVCRNGEIFAGGRNRWLSPKIYNTGPDPDQFGFAEWVAEREEDLWEELGPGIHAGEWFGYRINRGYGIPDRRFALFRPKLDWQPHHCTTVPILYEGMISDGAIEGSLEMLRTGGSVAVPGYTNPEGIVIYHTASKSLWKITIKHDEIPKELVKKNDENK